MRPRLLDFFCCAGGSAVGYYRAGFDVYGIDNRAQPDYWFPLLVLDAIEALQKLLDGKELCFSNGDRMGLEDFAAFHASPPCQGYSEATPISTKYRHPRLIKVIHNLFVATGKPYVIENVEGARWDLENPLMLCGSMFGLGVWRHRWFEVSPDYFLSPFSCNHSNQPVTINPPQNARRAQGGQRDFEKEKSASGIWWMNKYEISQAIPPAYTEYIGEYLIKIIVSGGNK